MNGATAGEGAKITELKAAVMAAMRETDHLIRSLSQQTHDCLAELGIPARG